MSFNLDDYEPVDERLGKFWSDYPGGRVLTTLEQTGEAHYIILASVYTTPDDDRPSATGWAQENVTAKGVNSTSALENCETSAIGRALANLGYATKGKRASREEMRKTQVKPSGRDWKAEIDAAKSIDDLHGLWFEAGELNERTQDLEGRMSARAAAIQAETFEVEQGLDAAGQTLT